MGTSSTRDALMEHGALLFARRGVGAVSTRELHEAAGARNESAVHYHFGGQRGLVEAILAHHLDKVEQRRAVLVERIEAEGATRDLRALVHALAAPMAEDLATPVGRAHLRIVAQLSHPALAYVPPFDQATTVLSTEAAAGATVVGWLRAAMPDLPAPICRERLAALRALLISLFGLRAQLIDDGSVLHAELADALFLENLIDMAVAALSAPVSVESASAAVAQDQR